jgi:hypothetical protein
MESLRIALQAMPNKEVVVWLNHSELKSLGGRIINMHPEHFEFDIGDNNIFYIPYTAIVAINPG